MDEFMWVGYSPSICNCHVMELTHVAKIPHINSGWRTPFSVCPESVIVSIEIESEVPVPVSLTSFSRKSSKQALRMASLLPR